MNPSRTRYEPVKGSIPIRFVEENYPPLIHPIKGPLNRGILLDTPDGKTGKLRGKYWTVLE